MTHCQMLVIMLEHNVNKKDYTNKIKKYPRHIGIKNPALKKLYRKVKNI